jgi:hypothetical protein
MGPRGSALICGYTAYHNLVEKSLAELKKKEVPIDVFNFYFILFYLHMHHHFFSFESLLCSGSAGLPSLPYWVFCQHGCNDGPGEY